MSDILLWIYAVCMPLLIYLLTEVAFRTGFNRARVRAITLAEKTMLEVIAKQGTREVQVAWLAYITAVHELENKTPSLIGLLIYWLKKGVRDI